MLDQITAGWPGSHVAGASVSDTRTCSAASVCARGRRNDPRLNVVPAAVLKDARQTSVVVSHAETAGQCRQTSRACHWPEPDSGAGRRCDLLRAAAGRTLEGSMTAHATPLLPVVLIASLLAAPSASA